MAADVLARNAGLGGVVTGAPTCITMRYKFGSQLVLCSDVYACVSVLYTGQRSPKIQKGHKLGLFSLIMTQPVALHTAL